MTADEALLRSWNLGDAGWTPAVEDEVERLLPILIEAGYASTYHATWRYTPEGVARYEELTGE
jgi:hypothetical protein